MRNLGFAALALAAAVFVQTSAHAAAPRTVVVMVGGLGSTFSSSANNFAPLVGTLVPRLGVREFTYGGSPAAYTSASSCQSIDTSTAELVDYVRGLRDRGEADRVILVGHSNGGVVALGVPAAAPDLVPLVRRIVTVDSPLGGIEIGQAYALGVRGGCTAGDELAARRASSEWAAYLPDLVAWERSSGIDVAAIVNAEDWAVALEQQQVAGVDVNYGISATGTDWNHAAVLHAPAAVAQLAAIVGAP